MVKKYKALLISAAICSCTTSQNWTCETLPGAIDSSRLTYISKEPHNPLRFEMLKIGKEVEVFISLERFHFISNNKVTVEFKIGEESFEDLVAVHEGRMRIRLHSEISEKIIQALQDGQEVVIVVDGFEETLDAIQFSSFYSQFLGKTFF